MHPLAPAGRTHVPGSAARHVALLALTALACSSPTQPVGVRVEVGGVTFARGRGGGVEVPFTVTNHGVASVLLTNTCGPRLVPIVECRVIGGWAQYAGGFCQTDQDMSPRPLAAGANRAEVARMFVEAGTYRLVLGTDRGSIPSGAFAVE